MKTKTLTVRPLLVGLLCALAVGPLETACAPEPADTKATEVAPAQTAAAFYDRFGLDKTERESMDRRLWILKLMIVEEPKGPIWQARDRLGERLPCYDEVERVGGED